MRRLAELNQKELYGQLTEDERKTQENLRAMMPTTAHTMN
ncbi:MAG: hypothetical protein NVSMB70_20740 [Chamaesiphon sp.]